MPSAVRLVIDTNVVVSAQLWGGVPRRLIELAHAGEISLFSSAPLLDELARVLAEPKFSPRFARSSTAIEDLVLGYAELVTLVPRPSCQKRCHAIPPMIRSLPRRSPHAPMPSSLAMPTCCRSRSTRTS